MTKIILDFPPDEARAQAQFVKRTGFDDCKRLASRYDGGVEAEQMCSAVNKLRAALAEAGHAPR
jgi:hypothetical protein